MCKRKNENKKSSWSNCKSLCKIAFILACISTARASIIPSPELPYGNDSVRTPDGFQCSSSISPSSYIDAGVFHNDMNTDIRPDKGVYIRILIPIYSRNERLDCSKLYNQELKERKKSKFLSDIKESIFK